MQTLDRDTMSALQPDPGHLNLHAPALYEEFVRRHEGVIAEYGPMVVNTGKHTGRSPNDKFFVQEPTSQEYINWGKVNQPFDAARFDALYERVMDYLSQRDTFTQQLFVAADPAHRIPIEVVTEFAWHSLFVRNLFIRPEAHELVGFEPGFTIIDAANFEADPARDGTNSSTFIIINFARKIVLIGGTSYAGEMKKSAFTLLNYLLPLKGVLPMHCSCNVGKDGDVAIFFGLSGTGKTTLSADPERGLVGDDEHGWSENGIFNFEGGCYAKVIKLSPTAEPEIYATTRMFGTVLENVVIDPQSRTLDLDSQVLTENTRAAYPLDFIPNTVEGGRAGHPTNIIMLTADAFGVLPPISRLTPEQAMYHFLSGYTAKVAGTEKGVTEPQATFSTCFGAPFMVHHPNTYAKLLGQKIAEHNVNCWLVNTGWSGGPYGVGERMAIKYTRAMIRAILNGELNQAEYVTDPRFQLAVPTACPNVPAEVLQPRNTWQDGAEYDRKAQELAARFVKNFEQYADQVAPEVVASGPKI